MSGLDKRNWVNCIMMATTEVCLIINDHNQFLDCNFKQILRGECKPVSNRGWKQDAVFIQSSTASFLSTVVTDNVMSSGRTRKEPVLKINVWSIRALAVCLILNVAHSASEYLLFYQTLTITLLRRRSWRSDLNADRARRCLPLLAQAARFTGGGRLS